MRIRMKRSLCAAGWMLVMSVQAAPVADVLDRPAMAVAQPAKSTLLGAAQAGLRLVAVGERGIIILSDDAGNSWHQAQVPVSVTLTAVRFVDDKLGFAVGHSGVVLSTQNRGENWTKQLDGVQAAQLALKAAQASAKPAMLEDAERLARDGADKPLLDLHFFDALRGIVVGAYNLALTTSDGGKTWKSISERLDNPKALHLYTIRSHGDVIVIAGEQGIVFRSDDAGQNFRRLVTPYSGSYFTAELPSDDEIVVAGLRGNVWRSVDRGASWRKVEVETPVSFSASAKGGDQGLVLASQAGRLFFLRDGRLSPLRESVQGPLNSITSMADGRLLTLGRTGAVVVSATGVIR